MKLPDSISSLQHSYTIGGLSGFNATLEARIKVMDNIGVALADP